MIKPNRLKAMEMHYSQLTPQNKKIVDEGIHAIDDWIEDILLEQNYHHNSKFIREYRKHYSLRDIKKDDVRNRIPVIHSRIDGNVREINASSERGKAVSKAVYEQKQRERSVKDILGSK